MLDLLLDCTVYTWNVGWLFFSFNFRSIFFSHGGECLLAGCQDVLKVYGWEPARTFDTIPVGWGKIQDIAIAQNQLVNHILID